MELFASGRDADVFAHEPDTILRRYRDGRSAAAEAEVLGQLHALGYPVPAIRAAAGPDLVLERIDGGTMADRLLAGNLPLETGGMLLAALHDQLHALPWPGGLALLHLDLHPENVLMGPGGPAVIDRAIARPGPAGLDVAMTALILAQVAVTPGALPLDAERAGPVRDAVTVLLRAFAAAVSIPFADH
jgi:Ser/Thr protein kinase RdoA (MazF antagonist)